MSSNSASARSDAGINQVAQAFQVFSETLQNQFNTIGDSIIDWLYPAIAQATQLIGRTVAPIADLPFIKLATGIPGLSWLLAALGQVSADKVSREVANLRINHPLETDEQLVYRVIAATSLRAAQIGLLTNIVPPVALFLFAVDLGAIAALQAEMIYKIAAIYGFSTDDAERRGEVLAIWAVFTGSSGTLKSSFSFLELLPGAGTVIGISSDAAIIYGVGFLACRYYTVKLKRQLDNGSSTFYQNDFSNS
ncbi:MAG: EcsC family protein [Leptolyngbyaceae cyanobacterium]